MTWVISKKKYFLTPPQRKLIKVSQFNTEVWLQILEIVPSLTVNVHLVSSMDANGIIFQMHVSLLKTSIRLFLDKYLTTDNHSSLDYKWNTFSNMLNFAHTKYQMSEIKIATSVKQNLTITQGMNGTQPGLCNGITQNKIWQRVNFVSLIWTRCF